MTGRVAMCVDEAACRNPRIIGLDGEVLDSQDWLSVFTEGATTRTSISDSGSFEELWVVSCHDVEPINLAASVKEDNPRMRVRLVTSDACGSLFSRAHNARIDEVIEYRSFPRRYAELKHELANSLLASSSESRSHLEKPSNVPSDMFPELAARMSPELAARMSLKPVSAFGTNPEPALSGDPAASLVASSALTSIQDARAFVLTVVSGSGGAGKSATSVLAAVIARNLNQRTLLLDCDLQFGDVAEMVGAENPLTLDEAMLHPGRLDAAIEKGGMLTVIAAPARLEASEEISEQIPEFLERMMMRFEVVVVNTGASWAEQHAALLERSSAALFLIDQRASSVRACRHALELCARCGIATGPFQYALNRCSKGAPLTSIDVSCALQGVPVFELKDGGRDVEDYLSGGEAAQLVELNNEFAKSVEQVIVRLLPGIEPNQVGQQGATEDRLVKLRRGFSRKHGRKS